LSAKAFALGRYDPDGRPVYAGRAGTHRHQRGRPQTPVASPAAARDRQNAAEVPPPRSSRFGSPLVLSRVH